MIRLSEQKQVFVNVVIIVICALFSGFSFASQDTEAKGLGRSTENLGSQVYAGQGNVYVKQGENPEHRVGGHEPIVSDSVIRTDNDSTALLKFEDGQIVTLQSNSSFRVRKYQYDAKKIENSNIIFSMLKGGMRFITGLIGQRNKQAFRLLTPNATLGIRGTEFMVVMEGNSLYSQVQAGKITLTNPAGMTVIGAGKSAIVASSGSLAAVVAASEIPVGTFNELLSIPVDPAAIIVPEPIPVAIPVPEPLVIPEPEPEPEPQVEVLTQVVEPPPEVTSEQTATVFENEDRSGVALTGKIGTLGIGAELNMRISDSINTRFGINGYSYKANANITSVNYDMDAELQTASALADWYPLQGSFRATAGIFFDNNKVGMLANPTGGIYTINGVPYSASGISNLQGKMSFNAAAPYVGIGWGNPVATSKGWGLTTDIGVLFQGKPRVDMSATCNPLVITSCPQFEADLEAERVQIESDLSYFNLWPVASIGITYQW